MAVINQQPINFDPNSLQPAGQPSRMPYGVQSGSDQENPESAQQIVSTPMVDANGTPFIKIEHFNPATGQSTPMGYATNQGKLIISQGQDGQWTIGNKKSNSFFGGLVDTVLGDKKLMAFLGVAGGVGALAASGALGATGGAGGAMLGSGTGATPGVVSGGVNGVAGLGGVGAAAPGVTASQIASQVGIPELGLVADPATAGAAYAGGIPTGSLGAGSGAMAAGALQNIFSGQGGSNGYLNTIQEALGGLFGDDFNLGDVIRGGGQLALMREMYENQKGQAEEWRNFMRESTPDLGFYQGKLRESYENPGSWLSGPEYTAAQNIVHNKLQRSDAAGGRLANDFGRQVALQDHAMAGLEKYRSGLGSLVNQQQNTYSGQAGGALQNAMNAENDWMKNLMNWLSGTGGGN